MKINFSEGEMEIYGIVLWKLALGMRDVPRWKYLTFQRFGRKLARAAAEAAAQSMIYGTSAMFINEKGLQVFENGEITTT